jgi:hypothetical protein
MKKLLLFVVVLFVLIPSPSVLATTFNEDWDHTEIGYKPFSTNKVGSSIKFVIPETFVAGGYLRIRSNVSGGSYTYDLYIDGVKDNTETITSGASSAFVNHYNSKFVGGAEIKFVMTDLSATYTLVEILLAGLTPFNGKTAYDNGVYDTKISPFIIHNSVVSLNETHNYNSVNLYWDNPIDTGFTETIIKQNGVEVTSLPKTSSSYSITGLNAETTYDFEVIAKYSDGGTSIAENIEILTDAAPIDSVSTANVTVNPGALLINSFPAILEFEDYAIGTSNAELNLKDAFKISAEDFTGSYSGWNLTMTVANLTSGSDVLKNPTLNSNFAGVSINDADDTGLETTSDTSVPGTFSKIDGTISFDSAKKILSAQITNPDAVARHYFNFPADSLELSFDNSIKAGFYTGVTTFTLVASP